MHAPDGVKLQVATPHGAWQTHGPILSMPSNLFDPGPVLVNVKVDPMEIKDYPRWRWRVVDAISEASSNECHFELEYSPTQAFPPPGPGVYAYIAESPCNGETITITETDFMQKLQFSSTSFSALRVQISPDDFKAIVGVDNAPPGSKEYGVNLATMRALGDTWSWRIVDANWPDQPHLRSNVCTFKIASQKPPPPPGPTSSVDASSSGSQTQGLQPNQLGSNTVSATLPIMQVEDDDNDNASVETEKNDNVDDDHGLPNRKATEVPTLTVIEHKPQAITTTQSPTIVASGPPSGFKEQASHSGNCRQPPAGAVCLSFPDGYVWLVTDTVQKWEDRGSVGGKALRVAVGTKAEYHHLVGTRYVREVKR